MLHQNSLPERSTESYRFLFVSFFGEISLVKYISANDIQGVPQNMTIARRLESCLWSWNLFLTFSRQPTSTCMIFKRTTTKFSSSWDFQNVVCLFFTVNITGDIRNFVQIGWHLNENLHISGNIQSTKKAD